MRVLIVEDEPQAAQTLVQGLKRSGHDVATVGTGTDALNVYGDAELILLTLALPDIDGLEVCRRIRNACGTPMIAFTDRGAEVDRILGLQAGADDCLDKPYEFRELLARIDAVLRRSAVPDKPQDSRASVVLMGDLRIDAASRRVSVKGHQVDLTRKEFDLLYYLARSSGAVVNRQRLMAEIWGAPTSHQLSSQASRTIDTHVSSLRSKLGESSWIQTVRGVGFRFAHR